jgi:hypothetical protein
VSWQTAARGMLDAKRLATGASIKDKEPLRANEPAAAPITRTVL